MHEQYELASSSEIGRFVRLTAVPLVRSCVEEVILLALAIGLLGSTGSIDIRYDRCVLTFDLMQYGRKYAPRLAQLIGSYEMHLRAAENIENKSLIGIR